MDLPETSHVYRYWVELRDRRDGSRRTLPLGGITRIHLTTKNGQVPRPDEHVLQLQDGLEVIEAQNLDGLRVQLRAKYPDDTHERFLHQERDVEAERRKAEAMDALMRLIVDAVVEDLERDLAGSDRPGADGAETSRRKADGSSAASRDR